MDVQGTYKQRWQDLTQPGDFMYTGRMNVPEGTACGLLFRCPCGCGSKGSLQLDTEFADRSEPTWTWNGNRERPTLTPSIHRVRGCGWHGYLTDGVFRPC